MSKHTQIDKGVMVADCLIKSLYGHGVRHVFGVPGDYVLGLYDRMAKSRKIRIVTTCDEQGAGFAADAYARIRGLGVVCVTYGVGALKVTNTTSQAFAEKSPVLVVSGSPGLEERRNDPLLHHKVRDFGMQKRIFDEMTCDAVVIEDPKDAAELIERVISSVLRYKQPGYIELPRDVAGVQLESCAHYDPIPLPDKASDFPTIREAANEAISMIKQAERPVIIAGEEVHRFGLQDLLLRLVDRTQIPVAVTILGKSVIDELNPVYIGVYEGMIGRKETREFVESSDCIIILGASLSDVTLGMFTAKIDRGMSIYAASEKITIRYHRYEGITMKGFIEALVGSEALQSITRKQRMIPHPSLPKTPSSVKGKRITVKYLFDRLNFFLKDNMIVLADVGDSLYASADLVIHGRTRFLSPAYYASLGFAVPASIGVQIAERKIRPVVIVGDGAFQMTGVELTTVARNKLNPVVIVLNNGVYLTEELILKGEFNDLFSWNYSRLVDVIGGGRGFIVETEDQLDNALDESERFLDGFSIIDVRLRPDDKSPAIKRMTEQMSKMASYTQRR